MSSHSAPTARAASLTAVLMRPDTEVQACDMIHYLCFVLVALGIVGHFIAMKFVDDVYYGARRAGETWQLAHETVTTYLEHRLWCLGSTLMLTKVAPGFPSPVASRRAP